MIWAIRDNCKVKALPKEIAICPICNEEVIAKCGTIKIWHWSHKSVKECDGWAEPESEWHHGWKQLFPKEQQEVAIGKHRADIKTRTGRVIELQSSPISSETIIERENFYGNMIWLLNGETIAKNFSYRKGRTLNRGWINRVNWCWAPSIYETSKKLLFIDKKNSIIRVNDDGSCNILDKKTFLNLYCDIYGNQ